MWVKFLSLGAFFGQQTIFIYKYQFNHAPGNQLLAKAV